MVTLSPDGVKLTEKGKRKGQGVSWKGLVNGEAATALSLTSGASESDSDSESEAPPSTAGHKNPWRGYGGSLAVPWLAASRSLLSSRSAECRTYPASASMREFLPASDDSLSAGDVRNDPGL
jgi:hypothetical protein